MLLLQNVHIFYRYCGYHYNNSDPCGICYFTTLAVSFFVFCTGTSSSYFVFMVIVYASIHTYSELFSTYMLHIHTCTCMHAYLHKYIHMYVHIHTYIHTYWYMHTCACTYIYKAVLVIVNCWSCHNYIIYQIFSANNPASYCVYS